MSSIEIGEISAKNGEKIQGFVDVGETTSGPVRIPVVIINGVEDGPTLCVTAGVHATEYASIDAAMRLIQKVKPEKLAGSLIVVPVCNMHMFLSRTGFTSPLDGLNLNKIAPGSSTGSSSERLAYILINEVIARAQYHVDLHAGDVGEDLWPFSACAVTGDTELDRRAETLARLYSPCLISRGQKDGLLPPFPGFLVLAAAQKAVASILAEYGGDSTLRPSDVEGHLRGIFNIMRYLRMVEGTPVVAPNQVWGKERVLTRANRAGLLRLDARIGQEVQAGQKVGEICNVFGEVVDHVVTPAAGIVGLVWSHKVVNSGDPIVRCWVTEPAPPFAETDRFVT